MTQDYTHPIAPPPELVDEWASMFSNRSDEEIFSVIAQWGADQELEAVLDICKQWLTDETLVAIRAARRPKPPSLKEQALEQLNGIATVFRASYGGDLVCDTIRRALEQLDD